MPLPGSHLGPYEILSPLLNPIVRPTQTPGTLARAPMAGGVPREIAEGVLQADWSPDGTQLAIVRGTATGQVLEYPIGKKLFENNGWIGSPKVSPNGELTAADRGRDGANGPRRNGAHAGCVLP